VGGGASAVNIAHLLHGTGIDTRIITRSQSLSYNTAPDPDRESFFFRLQNPPSPIGRGWRSFFCAQAPLLFYRLPRHLRDRAINSHLHPASGWYMRDRVEGHIPQALGRSLVRAQENDGRVSLELRNAEGGEETVVCDHVIAGTGYHVDLARIPFLAPELRNKIELSGTSPVLSEHFETSVPGLFTVGLTAMDAFGPLMRFMVGADFAARRLADHFDRANARESGRRAA
jgi:pyruvate/2-oxoglutarate dehydrogenase complex dihydrolipoamide dehydrogenase (E3) component